MPAHSTLQRLRLRSQLQEIEARAKRLREASAERSVALKDHSFSPYAVEMLHQALWAVRELETELNWEETRRPGE